MIPILNSLFGVEILQLRETSKKMPPQSLCASLFFGFPTNRSQNSLFSAQSNFQPSISAPTLGLARFFPRFLHSNSGFSTGFSFPGLTLSHIPFQESRTTYLTGQKKFSFFEPINFYLKSISTIKLNLSLPNLTPPQD